MMMRYNNIVVLVVVLASITLLLSGCQIVDKYFDAKYSDDITIKEILIYIKTGDKNRLKEHVKLELACQASKEALEDDVRSTPVYVKNDLESCSVFDMNSDNHDAYYADENCLHSVAFEPTDYKIFCDEIIPLDKPSNMLGNAAFLKANDSPVNNSPTQKWTLPYGTRMKITNESTAGDFVPYMKRVNYKTITDVRNSDGSVRGNGTCKLEMRVYKRDITATNLQPLLAIHGGSWKFRLAGFQGMEATISKFTDQGFIVFAPFYRLVGDAEANVECNNVTSNEVVSDVEDALQWVWKNGELLGAEGNKPVAITGQSAGAHLSMWLLVHPERHNVPVSRALLLYPPTDFNDFVTHAVTGGRYEVYKEGIDNFTSYFAVNDIREVSEQTLADNSFPSIVDKNVNIPPVFIIHGVADKVVPSMQSVRLCNAYERNTTFNDFESGPAINDGGDVNRQVYMKNYNCGSESKLYLLSEADHIFDFKCLPGFCFAGSKESIPSLIESLKTGREWLMGTP